jgi:Domain of unknown function (DUF4402)
VGISGNAMRGNSIKSTALALVCALTASGWSVAADAATQSTTVKSTIRKPVTITLLRDLDFGRIVATPTAGTVTLDPDTGGRTTTGGSVLAGGAPQTARFRVVATPTTLVVITRNALPVLTQTPGGATMSVTLITMSGTSNPVVTPASGTFDFDIGGDLAVAANQAAGSYAGTFQINANYQ